MDFHCILSIKHEIRQTKSGTDKIRDCLQIPEYADCITGRLYLGKNALNYPNFIKWAISEIKSCPKWPKLLFCGQFCILETNNPINDFDQKPV